MTPLIPIKKSGECANMDFEAFSFVGYFFDSVKNCIKPLVKGKPGIKGAGAAVYAFHPSTKVLMLSYNLCDGKGVRLWVPGMPPPVDLLEFIKNGGIIESHNSLFEYLIWNEKCVPLFGWPELSLEQQRCSMAKARAHSLPGKLDKLCEVLNVTEKKDKRGDRLIKKFCCPRTPTKNKPYIITLPEHDLTDYNDFMEYNIQDSKAESACSQACPDLSPFELEVWQTSQKINIRGVAVDVEGLENCKAILEQAVKRYGNEIVELTCGEVGTIDERDKLIAYCHKFGVSIPNIQKDTIVEYLERDDLPPKVYRVLQLRQILSSASVKKLDALDRLRCPDNRLRDLLIYYGALTGRWTGSGVQPQNLTNSGPSVKVCLNCGRYFTDTFNTCPHGCSSGLEKRKWNVDAVEDCLTVASLKDLDVFEYFFGDALTALGGCLRGLFVAGPGKDLICSDFSAIEAVVAAFLAGETWRMEVFQTHGKIYEAGASKITGIPLSEFLNYPDSHNGADHPLRKSIGKVSELASAYKGWINAWKNFGADEYFDSDEEIKEKILAWRENSPAIVEMWGGQVRRIHPKKWAFKREYFGLEGAAILAVLNPGTAYGYQEIKYVVHSDDVLYCRLPSGRNLAYHKPRLAVTKDRFSKEDIYQLSYEFWNSDSSKAPVGWMRGKTHGGKLFENVCQAVARDILAYALVKLENAGYHVVLHVHDEIIVEIEQGKGSIEEVEKIMSTMPPWCKNWPIKATKGWRGRRYRK